MAAAVCLTDAAVAARGEFGRAVQARLVADGASFLDSERPEPGAARVMVLVSWRPEPDRAELFDRLAHERAIAFLPAVIEHPLLTVGPWVAPGGPCFACYAARRHQHDPKSRHRADLLSAYRADDTLGVFGHLPHHVRAAEALIRLMLESARPGRTIMVDMATMMSSPANLIGRHGCFRCGATDSWGDSGLADVIAATVAEGGPA